MARVKKSSEKSHVEWTVRKLLEMVEYEEIDFNIDIQRAYVWKDNDQKSALIQTLILDDLVPPLFFNRIDNKWEGIDGKQKTYTIVKFVDGKFALSGVQEITIINDDGEEEDIDINGLYYNELPECIQKAIMEFTFTICFKMNADQQEVARNFYNLNNGIKINTAKMSYLKAKSMEQLSRLGKHKVFLESLTQKDIEGNVNNDFVARAHAMLYAENPETNASWVRKYTKNVNITPEEEEQLNRIFDRICNVHSLIEDEKTKKKMYRKTHLISIVPVIWRSIEDGLSEKETMKWFVGFFTVKGRATTISSIYNSAASRDGTGKREAVRKRLDELEKNYDEYIRMNNLL